MAKENLFELSTMLRMQLPILFSFATLRWFAGTVMGGVGGRLMRKAGLHSQLDVVVSDLRQVRYFFYVTLLATLVAAWLNDRLHNNFFVDSRACAPYEVTRVQGLACAVGMVVLITNGNMLALALALATFKAVADTSVMAVGLAVATMSVALAPDPSVRHELVVSAGLGLHCAGCLGDSVEDRSGGAVLGLAFLWVHMCARAARSVMRFCVLQMARARRRVLRRWFLGT